MNWQVCILVVGVWKELDHDYRGVSRKDLSTLLAELYPRGTYRIRRR